MTFIPILLLLIISVTGISISDGSPVRNDHIRRSDAIRESLLNETSEYSKWAKLNRRKMIKAQVERVLNVGGRRLPSAEDLSSSMEQTAWDNLKKQLDSENPLPNPTSSSKYWDYTEKLRSLFPTCNNVPMRAQRLFMSRKKHGACLFYFDIKPEATIKNDYHLEVITGRLQLFKTYPKDKENDDLVDRKVRITVSWVKRKNRVTEYVMLDSKMLPMKSNRWISLDVLLAVRYWYRRPRKNYGLLVEVEDMDRNKLKASDFITPMNCSDTTTPAFPSILDTGSPFNFSINSKLYPLLDVSTVELPNYEAVPDHVSLINLRREPTSSPMSESFLRKIDESDDDESRDYLMKFPIFRNNRIRATEEELSGESFMSLFEKGIEEEPKLLEKIEDVSFMDLDPKLSKAQGGQKNPPFRPIAKQVIRSREELISALKTLVEEESSQLDLQRNILDTIDLEEKIMNKLTFGGGDS